MRKWVFIYDSQMSIFKYHRKYLRCLLSRENLNGTFSALYIEMAITFDLLNQFQENKFFQTPQTINNILKSNTKW